MCQVKVKAKLSLHGTFLIDSAQIVEEEEFEETVKAREAPLADGDAQRCLVDFPAEAAFPWQHQEWRELPEARMGCTQFVQGWVRKVFAENESAARGGGERRAQG